MQLKCKCTKRKCKKKKSCVGFDLQSLVQVVTDLRLHRAPKVLMWMFLLFKIENT